MQIVKKYIAPFLGVYFLVMLFYYAVSLNLGNTPLFLQARRFVPAALAFCLPFFLLKNLRIRDVWHIVLVSVSYVVTGPLLIYISLHKTATILSYPFDIAFGLYLLPSLLFAHYFISRFLPDKFSALAMSTFELLLLLPNIFQIFYFIRFDHCITSNGSMVIYQTNLTEAMEYIHSMEIMPVIMLLIILFIIACVLKKYNEKLSIVFSAVNSTRQRGFIIAVLGVLVAGYAFGGAYKRIYFNELVLDTHSYFQQIEKFKTQRQNILDGLQVKQQSDDNGTIILVIGESATRNYMSAFAELEDDTTPWLKSQKHSENFILFNNSYSCAWNTVPALEHALTDANFYNNIRFNHSVSIIDIAKRAGYKTYWFSNQGTIGAADTPITLVAKTADVSRWTSDETAAAATQYDEVLLQYLKMVNPKEKNFVVFHLMGSHIDYNNRYPQNFQKWTDPGETGRLADYKNSVLYTDNVLERFFMQAKENLPLSVFVYCSDHGTDPNRRRNPDESGFVVLRIPMFVYLSERYVNHNPREFANLKAHQDAYWSNDLLYDLLCGIMKVESNHVKSANSLASDAYQYNKATVKAGLGERWVKDDKYD